MPTLERPLIASNLSIEEARKKLEITFLNNCFLLIATNSSKLEIESSTESDPVDPNEDPTGDPNG